MRGFWIGLGALVAFACGGSSDDDSSPAARGGAGHGGHADASRAGSSGKGAAGSGGDPSASGVGGAASGVGGSGAARTVGDGGQPESEAGGGGVPDAGSAGAPTDDAGAGGQADSSGGSGGRLGASAGMPGVAGGPHGACDCDDAHECVDGQCQVLPECDCDRFHVECGPLEAALGASNFNCPVDVQCGACRANDFCTIPFASPNRRECVSADSCRPSSEICPETPGWPAACSVQVSCGSQNPVIELTDSGLNCKPGCGPQL